MIKKYNQLKRKIEAQTETISILYNFCYGTSSPANFSFVKIPKKDYDSKYIKYLDKIIILQKRVEKQKNELVNIYTKIDSILNRMENYENGYILSQVIRLYDLNYLTFYEISEKMGYSEFYIKNMHSKAIKLFKSLEK